MLSFRHAVKNKYLSSQAEHRSKGFTCWTQLVSMSFVIWHMATPYVKSMEGLPDLSQSFQKG